MQPLHHMVPVPDLLINIPSFLHPTNVYCNRYVLSTEVGAREAVPNQGSLCNRFRKSGVLSEPQPLFLLSGGA